jgi:uncharacterized metal-binding protein
MSNNSDCICNGGLNLIFSCSGAADVGGLSDLAARKLTKEGVGKMYCLAGIGGNVSGIVESTKSADKILAIDGCPVSCTKKLLERNGFNNFIYLELSELGLQKGKSNISDTNIEKIVNSGKELMF